jgi:initiation factor 1A
MVKNTKGGSGAKSQASKHVSSGKSNFKVRKAGEMEDYAVVLSMLGNRMCYVFCRDGKTRLCHIRGKFCGRGKSDNFLAVGVWCLIGIREFQSVKTNKPDDCDLLEVYKNSDKNDICDGSSSWRAFLKKEAEMTQNTTFDTGDLEIEFNQKGNGYQDDMDMLTNSTKKKVEKVEKEEEKEEEEEINIEDI